MIFDENITCQYAISTPIHEDKTINAGEVPDPGPPDGATPEGSSEGDDHNGEESDEEGKVLDHAYAPD